MHKIDLQGIDWVIAGGESGPGARAVDPDWIRDLRDRCLQQDVRFFFKQWGGVFKVQDRPRSGRPHLGRIAGRVGTRTSLVTVAC